MREEPDCPGQPAETSDIGGAGGLLVAQGDRGSLVAQRDVVRPGDGVGLDGSESFAKTLASLPK